MIASLSSTCGRLGAGAGAAFGSADEVNRISSAASVDKSPDEAFPVSLSETGRVPAIANEQGSRLGLGRSVAPIVELLHGRRAT